MTSEFNNLDDQEHLAAENDFLKMKLMLEHGAHFVVSEDHPIPGEVENLFLNNIVAFEKEFENRKTIRLFDKIGQPSHFRPVAEVPDEEIEEAWQQLRACLNEHDINLSVCSPNISVRELYRFVIEELFFYEMDDMNLPGWISHFIYDEFHPDPVYENSRLVREDLFRDIFRIEDLFYEVAYDSAGFDFNDKHFTNFNTYNEKISRFKSLYKEIEMRHCDVTDCSVDGEQCIVKGSYNASATDGRTEDVYQGKFEVKLIRKDLEYWYIKAIRMEGFNP